MGRGQRRGTAQSATAEAQCQRRITWARAPGAQQLCLAALAHCLCRKWWLSPTVTLFFFGQRDELGITRAPCFASLNNGISAKTKHTPSTGTCAPQQQMGEFCFWQLARPAAAKDLARPRPTACPPFSLTPWNERIALGNRRDELKRGSLSICRYRWPHDYRPVFSIQGEAYSDGHRASEAVAALQ